MPSTSRNAFPRGWRFGATGVAVPLFAALPVAAQPSDTSPASFPDFPCDGHERHEDLVARTSIPCLFDHPFITTALKFATTRRGVTGEPVIEGGGATVLASRARVAVTDRFALAAAKNGVAFLRPEPPLLGGEDVIVDIPAGFVRAPIDRSDDEFILTTSLTFEIPPGDPDILEGKGDPA